MSNWVFDDGGRAAAGYKGNTGDCAVRAIAITTGRPYSEVYDEINRIAKTERPKKNGRISNSRTGVFTHTVEKYLASLGAKWVATMGIGTGCKVHLNAKELPKGRIIARCSKHYAAVIDGVIHDLHDCSRDGTRCVYGYWIISL
jgi:hypothetical protein